MSSLSEAAQLRQRLYAGEIVKRPATPASRALADGVMRALAEVLGPEPRRAHERGVDVHAALGSLREYATQDDAWWCAVAAIVLETGFDLDQQLGDPPRVRALAPDVRPEHAPRGAYAVHRDTWYANPACQVNWWLAVHDLDERESFAFYPSYFDQPIANDSHRLDYVSARAAQAEGRLRGPTHPPDTLERPPLSEALRFSLAAGEMLLFSGAHLHGGMPVTSGRVRFSLDFRTADAGDLAAGRGAPVLDVACRGATVDDYVSLGRFLPQLVAGSPGTGG